MLPHTQSNGKQISQGGGTLHEQVIQRFANGLRLLHARVHAQSQRRALVRTGLISAYNTDIIDWAFPVVNYLRAQFFENTAVNNIFKSFIKFCESVLLFQLDL